MRRQTWYLAAGALFLSALALSGPGCSRFASVFYVQENPQALQRDTIRPDGTRSSVLDFAAGKANGVIQLVPIEPFGPMDSLTLSVPPAAREAVGAFGVPRRILAPRGFSGEVLAWNLGRARDVVVSDGGTMFVSDMEGGRILAVTQDGTVTPIVTGLDYPHGLDIDGNRLFYATVSELFRYDFTPSNPTGGTSTLLTDRLPDAGDFFARTIRYKPADRNVYVSIAATDANGEEEDREHATLFRVSQDGGNPTRYLITGLRNTTGLDFHPETGDLWGIDQGMDNLSEGLAPDEVNILVSGGQYGHPYFYSQNFRNPKYVDATGVHVPKSPKGPILEIQPYSGTTDAEFYTGNSLGPDSRNSLLAVFNGYESGAVVRPSELYTGAKVVRIRAAADGSNGRQADLFSGWLTGQSYWGRPVGIAVSQDGKSFFVTDEKNGVLYRFTAP